MLGKPRKSAPIKAASVPILRGFCAALRDGGELIVRSRLQTALILLAKSATRLRLLALQNPPGRSRLSMVWMLGAYIFKIVRAI